MAEKSVLISTTENIPGHKITKIFGEVFGITTRSRNMFSTFGQSMKTIVGGEIVGYTKLQHMARDEAIARLKSAAEERGANSVVMMRFDSNSFASVNEVTAYGTAVFIEPIEK